VLADAS